MITLKFENKDFYISTCNTPDRGLETMVFEKENGCIIWREVESRLHGNDSHAETFHKEMITKWVINENNN